MVFTFSFISNGDFNKSSNFPLDFKATFATAQTKFLKSGEKVFFRTHPAMPISKIFSKRKIPSNFKELSGPFFKIVKDGLQESPANQVLIEECLEGWKEFEMEVVRDKKDNCIIICSIENIDHMGFHTGDSVSIGPA